MKKLFSVISILVLLSCRNTQNQTAEEIIRIDLLSEPAGELKNLSEIASDIRYIPLQTTDSSLMSGSSRKIVANDERIYIQDRQELLCFDKNGQFLFKLRNEGRGPEEYTFISDFSVTEENKVLALLSMDKLLFYDISDQGFAFQKSSSYRDPYPGRLNFVTGEKVFLSIPPWSGNEPSLSMLINLAGDTIVNKPNGYKYEMLKRISSRASNEMLVYQSGNSVCFKEVFSDTVFYVDAGENAFRPKLILDSHGAIMTPGMRGGSESPGDKTLFVANVFESPGYVFYWFGTREKRNRIVFDKITGTKYQLNTDSDLNSRLKDDIAGGPAFNIEFMNHYCSGGKLFSFIEAISLKRYVESEDFRNAKVSRDKKYELKKMADSLNETDNPVLVIVTPKE